MVSRIAVVGLALASVVGAAMPVRASLLTAAYSYALSYCAGMRYGLTIRMAMSEAVRDTRSLYPREVSRPEFHKVAVRRAAEMCPELFFVNDGSVPFIEGYPSINQPSQPIRLEPTINYPYIFVPSSQ